MSDLSQLVDSLEQKVNLLLRKNNELSKSRETISAELMQLKGKQGQILEELDMWRDKYETLKVANTMLGSNQDKRETKLKINALIRELDHCIAFISE